MNIYHYCFKFGYKLGKFISKFKILRSIEINKKINRGQKCGLSISDLEQIAYRYLRIETEAGKAAR